MTTFPTRAELGSHIHVTGTSGSGKTTFAARLAGVLGVPHIELDALSWGPNWTEVPNEVFLPRVEQATAAPAWVLDGNYSRAKSIYWPRVHTSIFLDYPRWLVMWRVITRTLRRTLTREELWQGNRERLSNALFSKESIIRWSWNTYTRRRAQVAAAEQDPANAGVRFMRFKSPRNAEEFIQSLG